MAGCSIVRTYWVTAHQGGQTGPDTEALADAHADWLVKSKAATQAVVYAVDIEGEPT